jgi:hypothetical protein
MNHTKIKSKRKQMVRRHNILYSHSVERQLHVGCHKTSNVQHNSEACCVTTVVAEETNVLYSACLTEALVIQHARRTRRIVICGLYGCNVFFHIISENAPFSGKRVTQHKMCFDSLYNFWNTCNSKNSSVKYCPKCTYVCVFMSSTRYSRHTVPVTPVTQYLLLPSHSTR